MLRSILKMSTETAPKRLKTSGPLIGTHNGYFHADEALAVYMLRLLPTYSSSPVLRTRDAEKLKTCDIVVDVGGEYDASRNLYDHHQRSFDVKFPGKDATKLSSAGLVYLHFGRDIIAQELGGFSPSDPRVELLHKKLYDEFIEAVDAHDNGVSVYDPEALSQAGITKRFSSGGNTIGSLIGDLNPNWNDEPPLSQDQEDEKFEVASTTIGEIFKKKVEYYGKAWLPARELVQTAYEKNRHELDSQGRILILDRGMPWSAHLYDFEKEHGEEGKVIYILFPEKPVSSGPSNWRVRAVSNSEDSFVSRKALPDAWRGLRDEALDQATGLTGTIFVHASGFIGGAKTKEAAVKMAQMALEA